MKGALSFPLASPKLGSVHRFVPALSLVYLILSRTAFHHTRFEDSTFGLGIGTLLAYVIGMAFPSVFQSKEPEDNDLQTLNLSR